MPKSPPARGSTRRQETSEDRDPRDPARAGIDRDRRLRVTPHGRGSTMTFVKPRIPNPARAGIDPNLNQISRSLNRLPRTRGDRPVRTGGHLVQRNPARAGIDHPTERAARALSRSPPRTAGSGGNVGLYPVCAGTNRGRTCARRCCRTLPRARGDRPGLGDRQWDAADSTPHARGSTGRPPRAESTLPRHPPARAGIKPRVSRAGSDGFPIVIAPNPAERGSTTR